MLGLVVCGLRTWMCTMAAPALAASIEERAICSGVTGTAGLRPGVSAEPVTAQEIMTLRCIVPPNAFADDRCRRAPAVLLRAQFLYPAGTIVSWGGRKTRTTTNERRAFIRRRLIVVAVEAMGAYTYRPSPVTIQP